MKKVTLTNPHPDVSDVTVPQEQAVKMTNMGSGWKLKKGQKLDDAIISAANSGDTKSTAKKDGDCGGC